MADAVTIGSVLVSVVPVLVGGLLAIGGGGLTQWYLHNLKIREENRTRRAAKFEELVTGVYEHAHWLDEQKDARVFGGAEVTRMSPSAKVEGLTTIYFPEFDNGVQTLFIGANEYEKWMLRQKTRRLDGATSDFSAGFDEAYQGYLNAKTDLLEELKAFGRREFK